MMITGARVGDECGELFNMHGVRLARRKSCKTEICFTTRYILFTIPNCTLKMVKLINFRLYVFYHNKKYTCIYKDQVE